MVNQFAPQNFKEGRLMDNLVKEEKNENEAKALVYKDRELNSDVKV